MPQPSPPCTPAPVPLLGIQGLAYRADGRDILAAAVGTVDQTQLETLMARGLAPEEAIDVIVTGILQ